MSLYPGRARQVGSQFRLDDVALADSMAKAMEDELKTLHAQVKNRPMPDEGQEDRRLLFVAIARGILQYFDDHQEAVETDTDGLDPHSHDVTFNVTMNSHTDH